jgi:hypothetical protein
MNLPRSWAPEPAPSSSGCSLLRARLEATGAWDSTLESGERRAGFSMVLRLGRWHAPAAVLVQLPWDSLGAGYPLPSLHTVEYDLTKRSQQPQQVRARPTHANPSSARRTKRRRHMRSCSPFVCSRVHSRSLACSRVTCAVLRRGAVV